MKWYFSYLREKLHDPTWVAELSGYHSHRITKLVLIKTSQARQFCCNLNILIRQAMLEWSLCYQSTLCICSVWSAVSFDFSCLFFSRCPYRTLSVHVAEIYFRAWRKASGSFLEEIESTCIQDLMQHALLLHRNSPVHSKVRQVRGCISSLLQWSG